MRMTWAGWRVRTALAVPAVAGVTLASLVTLAPAVSAGTLGGRSASPVTTA